MVVSTWKGGTYGIRIGKTNVREYFDADWRDIAVECDGQSCLFVLSGTFRTTCPEIRGGMIPVWLRRHSLDDWPRGRPHKLTLISMGGNCFALHLPGE